MFIIFFGTRTVVSNDSCPGGGPHHCPHCNQVALFEPKRARPFFHIFWLPLFPLGQGEPILECSNCHYRAAA